MHLPQNVTVSDADWQKINQLFAEQREWIINANRKHFRKIYSMLTEERKDVQKRYKEYDGCYLGHYVQWFFWFFFTIGIFVVAGAMGMMIAQCCGTTSIANEVVLLSPMQYYSFFSPF